MRNSCCLAMDCIGLCFFGVFHPEARGGDAVCKRIAGFFLYGVFRSEWISMQCNRA